MAELRHIPLLEVYQLADTRLLCIDFCAAYHAAVNVKTLEIGLGLRNEQLLRLVKAVVPDFLRYQMLPVLA